MPLLEINLSRYISASVRLDESTAEQVDQYAAFVHASADDVVDKALNYVFSKDRDFQDFLKTPQAKQVASTLRVRKGPNKDAERRGGAASEEACSRGGVHGFCTGNEGVILHSISCRSKNGASHRKNFDTPPLEGYTNVNARIQTSTYSHRSTCAIDRIQRLRSLTRHKQEVSTMENPIPFKPTTDGSKRPLARNRILSARFMESEYAALENFAWSKGMTLADWVRDVLLHSLEGPSQAQMEMHIFTELVGIQMLLMNTLEPLLRGDKIAPEQLTILFRQVQTTKAAKAQELLAKRSQNREK